jgi:hypothetical protein
MQFTIAPELSSELERCYDLNVDGLLNVYGPVGCGKTTIVKCLLQHKKYYYLEDHTLSLNNFIETIKKFTPNDVLTSFKSEYVKSIVLIDNYDFYSFKIKDYRRYLKDFDIIVISNESHFSNSLFIPHPSEEYLNDLLMSIEAFCGERYKSAILTKSFHHFYNSLHLGDYYFTDKYRNELDTIRYIKKNKDYDVNNYNYGSIYASYVKACDDIDHVAVVASNLSDALVIDYPVYSSIVNGCIININLLDSLTSIPKMNYSKRNNLKNKYNN